MFTVADLVLNYKDLNRISTAAYVYSKSHETKEGSTVFSFEDGSSVTINDIAAWKNEDNSNGQ